MQLQRWIAGVSIAFGLSACVTYSPQQLSAMTPYQLCENQLVYRVNLTPEAKTRLAEELSRRREDCSGQSAAVYAAQRADLDRRTYDNVSP